MIKEKLYNLTKAS